MTDSTKAGFRQLSLAETEEIAATVAERHEIRLVPDGLNDPAIRCSCGEVLQVSFNDDAGIQGAAREHYRSAVLARADELAVLVDPVWLAGPASPAAAPEPIVAPANRMPESVGATVPWVYREVSSDELMGRPVAPYVLGPMWRATPLWIITDALAFIESVGDSSHVDYPADLVAQLRIIRGKITSAEDLDAARLARVLIEPSGANMKNVADVAEWVGRERDAMKKGEGFSHTAYRHQFRWTEDALQFLPTEDEIKTEVDEPPKRPAKESTPTYLRVRASLSIDDLADSPGAFIALSAAQLNLLHQLVSIHLDSCGGGGPAEDIAIAVKEGLRDLALIEARDAIREAHFMLCNSYDPEADRQSAYSSSLALLNGVLGLQWDAATP